MFTSIPADRIGLILAHTPGYVWALLAMLVALGSKQLRTSHIGIVRASITPAAMFVLSLYGTVSAFGASPAVLLAWLAAFAATAAMMVLLVPAPAGLRFEPAERKFIVPGSSVPLALMMGIFVLKYAVGVQLAMNPALRHHVDFMLVVAPFYGAFSGVFAARSFRMIRLALQHRRIAGHPIAATNTMVA